MGADTARQKLDAVGVEFVCDAIGTGESMTGIAARAGVSIGSLLAWIAVNAERSARVKEARTSMALLWDERAEAVIENAADDFELRKAKELSHHLRWRASKIAPREYGDKLQHTGDGGGPITLEALVAGAGERAADGVHHESESDARARHSDSGHGDEE